MTGPSDFSDAELSWLVRAQKYGATPPNEIEAKLKASGVVDLTDLGIRITNLGRSVLEAAQIIGRLPSGDVNRPKGPKGEKRPADAVGAAVMVAKIATGEIEDELTDDGKN